MLMQGVPSLARAEGSSLVGAGPSSAIEFDDVNLAFGSEDGTLLALDHVSLSAPRGQQKSGMAVELRFHLDRNGRPSEHRDGLIGYFRAT